MTQVDPEALKAWYRNAMRGRIEELEALRQPLAEGRPGAVSDARGVGHALLGSGATFGFPEISEAGRLVEDAGAGDLVRRVEGLLSTLRVTAFPDDPPTPHRWAWLADSADVARDALQGATDQASAWQQVSEAAGADPVALCRLVAGRFGLEVAELEASEAGAMRLVPPALLREGKVFPLKEDGARILVAAPDPTDLELEFRLERITGRDVTFQVADPWSIEKALAGVEGLGTGEPPTAEPRSPAAVSSPGRASGPGTVLVVDDSESARLLARAVLERKGYTVREAEDGLDALAGLEADAGVDLIVVDLEMPRMGGREFVRTYRAEPAGEGVPIVVVTGAEDPQLEADLIEDGADDYIHKPLDPRLFLARVTATMRRRGR